MDHVETSSRAPRPSWWKLDAFVTAGLNVVALVEMRVPAGAGRTAMQIRGPHPLWRDGAVGPCQQGWARA